MKLTLRHLPLLFVGVIAISALSLVACSDDDDDGGGGGTTAPTTAPTAAPSGTTTAGGSTVPAATVPPGAIRVSMVDFGYQPSTIPARLGQRLQLSVVNNGQTPHTFTIDGVTNSGGMSAGEGKLVEFTPAQAGTLTFYCTIHGRNTMSGELTVTP